MEIKIYRNADTEMALKKIIWRSYAQPKLILITLIIILGIVAIALAISSRQANFWRFETCLGIIILSIGLLRLRDYFKYRSNYFPQSSRTATAKSEITVTDDEIIYEAEDFKAIYQWHFYKFYKITNELILIKKDLSQTSQLIIAKSELSQKELAELSILLERKFLKRI